MRSELRHFNLRYNNLTGGGIHTGGIRPPRKDKSLKELIVKVLVFIFVGSNDVSDFYPRTLCHLRLYDWLYYETFGEYYWQTTVMNR